MRTALIALAAALLVAGVGSAKADDTPCPSGSAQGTMSLEQAVGRAEALGYAVKEAKLSKGCWKVEGFDRHGAEIEIRFDSASGDVVKPRDWRQPAGG